MPHTVNANKLTISHKGTPGFETNTTPDVCKTPPGPVPVPYKIISFSRDLIRGTKTVFADGHNSIAIKGSAHTPCYGDEPGVALGVISNTHKHESTWITYSPTVYAEGKNICRLTDKMFMNNRNCISASGHYEVPPTVTDPIMRELCKIFCRARDDWHKCKRSGAKKCTKPSKLAENYTKEELGKSGSKLNKAAKARGFSGRAEGKFFAALDDAGKKFFDGARKIYDQAGMKRAIEHQVKKFMATKGAKYAARLGAKAWMKAIPGLNIASTIFDVADGLYTGYEVINMVRNASGIADNALKVQPDFALVDENGSPRDIYDFKFDDPETGYQDDWQHKQKQHEAYEKATGDPPKKVDEETCECDKNRKGMSTS